jgi:hypothetical protein
MKREALAPGGLTFTMMMMEWLRRPPPTTTPPLQLSLLFEAPKSL